MPTFGQVNSGRCVAMMRFAESVVWRVSKRGLVLADPSGDTFLLEHPAAGTLPNYLADNRTAADVSAHLGGTPQDAALVADLIDAGILRDSDQPAPQTSTNTARSTSVRFTRSGLEITGIDRIARIVHRFTMPVFTSIAGRAALAAILLGGLWSLIIGRPDAPQVSGRPWLDATLGLVIGLTAAAMHELAHAVALVHYGRTPRSAGCGFYWGALCFYVDSTDGLTLPRRARIVQASAGLGVDVVTVSILAILAQLSSSTLLIAVCWRVAILGIVAIVENSLPILEVDGQLILSDLLDEPDLSSRARAALGDTLRQSDRRLPGRPRWLPAYGAFSLFGGVVLLAASALVWWAVAGDMTTALFTGSTVDIVIGLYVVVPFALGTLFSLVGLALETFSRTTRSDSSTNS
jgi:hypothetical protein